jgi:molybdopterin-guanine dinucleotide biosynthesis protein A
MEIPKATAIVLAGRRRLMPEELAISHGVSDKCLVPVGGRPLIEHVLETLASSPLIARIIISVNDPAILSSLPVCASLMASGQVTAMVASGNIADSVLAAAEGWKAPFLITTADNVMLTSEAIENMVGTAATLQADAAVAFARKGDILSAHPDGQRRFYEFADDGYSNCNCYWIGGAGALKAAEIFRSGGQFAKNPMRIANSFGIWNLIRFRMGWGSLSQSFDRLSRRMQLRLVPVIFTDGSLAIDVDNERTHRVVSELLELRSATIPDKPRVSA